MLHRRLPQGIISVAVRNGSAMIGANCNLIKRCSLPAFRTEFKILLRFKSTAHTSSGKTPVSRLHLCQMLRQYFYILAACDPSSDLRVKGIDRIAACALYIVLLVPFETRDEEQRQIHIGHEYLIPAIRAYIIYLFPE